MSDPAQNPESDAEAERIAAIFAAQQERAPALRTTTAAARSAKLKRLRDLVRARRVAIQRACQADCARPAAEIELTEILPVIAEANHAIRHLRRWMAPERKRPTLLLFGTRAEVRHEPRGVCLIISPWNYPITLSLGPLVSAIAAGNTVMLKPSEMTPHCAALIAELVDTLFADDEVAVIQGAVETAEQLLALPFDHIFFTGSPAVGRIVMAAAARHLASVTLELGGRSPAIVDKSADIDKAARTLVWSKFANNGQTCIAPDHVHVHAEAEHAFIAACRQALDELYGPRETLPDNPDYGRIINARHAHRIRTLIAEAGARSAHRVEEPPPAGDDHYIAPTLLTDVDPGARILREEIFGPAMPILTYTDIEQPLAAINAQSKPLALYVFARDRELVDTVLACTSAGGTCVNQAMLHFLHSRLPFGGVGNSGIGSAHGRYGFKAFSHERAVLRERFSLSFLLRPPYTRATRWLIRLAVKWLN